MPPIRTFFIRGRNIPFRILCIYLEALRCFCVNRAPHLLFKCLNVLFKSLNVFHLRILTGLTDFLKYGCLLFTAAQHKHSFYKAMLLMFVEVDSAFVFGKGIGCH